jgi:hypothetical protein
MRTKILFLLLSISLLAFAYPGQDQAPEEVVNKCIKALGGEKGIANFSNFKAAGEAFMSFGTRKITAKIKEIKKGSKHWRQMEMIFGSNEFKTVRAYNGQAAWTEARGNIVDNPPLNSQSDADHTPALLLEKEAGFKITGETEIEGQKTFRLEVDFKGKKTTFFIDQADYTIREISFKDLYFGRSQTKETIDKQMRYLDYKETNGFRFPFGVIYYRQGEKNMEVRFSEVTFDPDVSPDLFERPDREMDFRYREEKYH